MSTPRQGGALGDELANLGIIALITAACLAVILRAAGSITAWVTGLDQPSGGIEAGLGVLLRPGDPGPRSAPKSSTPSSTGSSQAP